MDAFVMLQELLEQEQFEQLVHVTLKMQKPLLMSMISQDIMIRMKHWLKIRMLRLFM